jgi:DNA-directed RNA polymerase subunit RPC12/RpoP
MQATKQLNIYGTKKATLASRFLNEAVCFFFGHDVSVQSLHEHDQSCSCGEAVLSEGNPETHVRHNLKCFFGGHKYAKIGVRDGHAEFVCEDCGHPLLFKINDEKYGSHDEFHKPVSYGCIFRGHRLHLVAKRQGLFEYACDCGHSFLLDEANRQRFWHPLICFFAGHFIRLQSKREGMSEFRCRNCGHPFCFNQ